jgi:hypothetical protein
MVTWGVARLTTVWWLSGSGVIRVPVREALGILINSGFVKKLPNQGMRCGKCTGVTSRSLTRSASYSSFNVAETFAASGLR